MRILFNVANFRKDVDLSMEPGSWIDRDFYPALERLGHDLVRFDWEMPDHLHFKQWMTAEVARKNRALVKFAVEKNREKRIDIMLSALDGRVLLKEAVEGVKALGITSVSYHCDDVNAFHLNEKMALVHDINWTVQPAAVPNYERAGAKYVYTPCGANPDLYKPYDVPKSYGVTFVGRNMGYREEVLQRLMDRSIDVRVWGEDWPHGGGSIARRFAASVYRHREAALGSQLGISWWYLRHYGETRRRFSAILPFEEMVKMYSRSHVNLNFSGGMGPGMYDFKKAVRSIKLRDIEVPMSGGFYMTEQTKDVEALFEIGREIEAWASVEELQEKAKHYLANPEEAERIAKAGREKARREYTWERNFKKLFEQAGLA